MSCAFFSYTVWFILSQANRKMHKHIAVWALCCRHRHPTVWQLPLRDGQSCRSKTPAALLQLLLLTTLKDMQATISVSTQVQETDYMKNIYHICTHPPPAAPPLMQCLTKSICCHWWLSSSVCCSALHHIALNVLYITTWRYNNHYLSAAALNWTLPVAWFKSCLHFLPIFLHLRSVSCRSGVNLSNHWQKKE